MVTFISKVSDRVGEQGLVWFVNLLLLALLAQAIASFTWQILEEDGALPTPTRLTPSIVNRTTQRSAILLAQDIANSHLFGQASIAATEQRGASAPETKLNLLLKGVIASSDVRNAVAFIAAGKGATEKPYAIGDNLPGGAILKEIYGERILLEYRGRMENLSLRRKVLTKEELGTQ